MAVETLSRRPVVQAVAFAATAEALLTFMDALIKGLSPRYATFEIVFLRFAFGTLWATILLMVFRPGWPSAETVKANISRSFLVVITSTCFFFALGRLPLAETVALSFISPVLMALFGGFFLKERIDRSIVMALMFGLAGMLLIVGARLGATSYDLAALAGVAAIFVSTVTYALNIIVLRTRAQRDPALTIVWFQSAAPGAMMLIPALTVWTPPSTADLAVFTGVGALAVAGHYLMALAFARAEAARLAPVHYTSLVWGLAFGYLMFAEVPTQNTLAGATLIAAAAWIAQRKPTI
jgi:drug/metabolite transporter (DMT)-like permease